MKAQRSSLLVDRRERTFITVIPDEVPADPTLVLYLHGSMQSSNVARNFTGNTFDALADDHGALVCYPDGVRHHFNDARRHFNEEARRMRVDDVGFLRDLIDALRDEYGVDRVVACGYSNGGQMVTRVLHDAPGLVDAAVLFAAPVPTEQNFLSTADGWVPTPVTLVHGTADPMVPYDGGAAGFEGNTRGDVRSAPNSAAYYAELNGATDSSTRELYDDVSVERFTGGAADVELWTVEGMGHVVPSPRELDARVGPGTDSFTGADVVTPLL